MFLCIPAFLFAHLDKQDILRAKTIPYTRYKSDRKSPRRGGLCDLRILNYFDWMENTFDENGANLNPPAKNGRINKKLDGKIMPVLKHPL